MERLMRTFFEMFQHDDVRKLMNEQEFICLPHYDMLVSLAPAYLQKNDLKAFEAMTEKLVRSYLETLQNDVTHYCNMYDYRNSGKDADWGNSKDSIERAVKFLTSRD